MFQNLLVQTSRRPRTKCKFLGLKYDGFKYQTLKFDVSGSYPKPLTLNLLISAYLVPGAPEVRAVGKPVERLPQKDPESCLGPSKQG